MTGGARRRRGRRGLRAMGVAAAAVWFASCTPQPGAQPTAASHVVGNSIDGAGRGTLTVDGCVLLDSTGVFTQRIDALPAQTFAPGADPIERAAAMLAAVNRNSLGSGASTSVYQNSVFGMPLVTVAGTTRAVTIGSSDYGIQTLPVLFPASESQVHWQGEPNFVDGDRHLMVLDNGDPAHCRLQEHISYANPVKTSGTAVEWTLPIRSASTPVRTDGHGPRSAEAAGLPIAPLVYRFNEVYPNGTSGAVGEIAHALRIAFPKDVNSVDAHVWPATHTDGTATAAAAMPMGARLRLSAAALARVEADQSVPAGALAILTALHRYGAVVGDSSAETVAANPGGFGLSGEYNPGWPAGVLSSLGKVHAEDFDLVDTSCWQGTDQFNVRVPTPGAC
ncbi:MAG: hypothetical protein R2698_01335 [Microthrixaceae bacterium]